MFKHSNKAEFPSFLFSLLFVSLFTAVVIDFGFSIIPIHKPTLYHIAKGQLIEQGIFESVFNLMRTTSAKSLQQLFTQVYKNYAVFYNIYFHAFLSFLFYVKL